jgi:hypothetical protein
VTAQGAPGSLEALEVEALVTDRYLEGLLAAAERRAVDAPADASLDPTLRAAALRLRDELVRVHPSFRFEDRLARRLAEAASTMQLAAAAGGETALVPFPRPFLDDPALARELADPELAALVGTDPAGTDPAGTGPDRTDPAARPGARPRPLLLGGAVTSAALSLAGAAFLAWRISRGAPDDAMARAARIARAARAGRDVLPRRLA